MHFEMAVASLLLERFLGCGQIIIVVEDLDTLIAVLWNIIFFSHLQIFFGAHPDP
jgi:hypothetical protein